MDDDVRLDADELPEEPEFEELDESDPELANLIARVHATRLAGV